MTLSDEALVRTFYGAAPTELQTSEIDELVAAMRDGDHDANQFAAMLRAVAEAAVQAEREGAVPFGWYFMDDPKVYTMPGSGFRVGPDRPADTLHASPLYLHPPQASATVPEGFALVRTMPNGAMLDAAVEKLKRRGVEANHGDVAACFASMLRNGQQPSAHQVVVENVAAFNGDIPMPGDGEAQR